MTTSPARRYRTFAHYNRWANRRLYQAAAALGEADYHAERGAFFGSVHRTLNHLLVTDRIWMARFAGDATGVAPRLDAVLFEALSDLARARDAEDVRIIDFAEALDGARLAAPIRYANSSGQSFQQPLDSALDHFFNHQTHHRGQVHALLTGLRGRDGAPSLDLIVFQRETGARGTSNG
ncbi:DinB family protein [Ancylobacter terrae]|uniref:DinB family protein n=1 Tax=Ancylobacter sp. sgz301288 TaxID=3342077 RepID=UPI00385A40BD